MLVHRAVGRGHRAARSITPTHNSLLSDYYPPEVRADVFGFHRDRARARRVRRPARRRPARAAASAGGCRSSCSSSRRSSSCILGLRLQRAGPRPLRARRGGRRAPTSSAPTRSRRRSRSRSASSGRSARCAASGTRCRSSRRRSSGSSRSRRSTTSRSSTSTSVQRGLVAAFAEPAQIVGIAARHPARGAADAARPRPRPAHARGRRRRHRRRRGSLFALAPYALARDRDERRRSPALVVAARARASSPRSRSTIPPKVRSIGLRDGVAVHPARPARALHRRRHRRHLRHPRRACSSWCRSSSSARGSSRRASLYVRVRHQPGVDVDRGAGRGDATSASRAR